MGPDELKMIRETYRLSVENNTMLRKMRRASLISAVFWTIVYAALIFGPIWFYMTYLNAPAQQLVKTYQDMQRTGAQAQTQYQDFNQAVQQILSRIPGMNPAASTSTKK